MPNLENLDQLDIIKVLSDTRRYALLRLLMAQPATLSQLGRQLGEHPAWIRYHIKQLERCNLVKICKTEISGGFIKKYYQASNQAYLIQQMVLPEFPEKEILVFMGSHDLSFELLIDDFEENFKDIHLINLPIGSLDGLISLRQGYAHFSGCHLYDPASSSFNKTYIQYIFPDVSIELITLAEREQGFIVAPGNPLHIKDLEDLIRPNVRFINRNRGSGTRLWFDIQLKEHGIPCEVVNGYAQEVVSHSDVAAAVSTGTANVGIGLHAAAINYNLDFVPLFQERYDFVIREDLLSTNRTLNCFFDQLQGTKFRNLVKSITGYETTHTGESIII